MPTTCPDATGDFPPGVSPQEQLEADVLVALTAGCPLNGLKEGMFTGARKTVFRVISSFVHQHGEAPGATLLIDELTRYRIAEIHRPEVERVGREIAEQLRHPWGGGERYFDVNSKRLRELYQRESAMRFLDDARQRVANGEDLSELGLMRLADAWQDDPFNNEPTPIGDLLDAFTSMEESIIPGVGRRGEVVNVVSGTKIGKTWLILGMALSAATGTDWLGHAISKPRNVLMVDNELRPATLAWRLKTVADALELRPEMFTDRIRVESVRGRNFDVNQLQRICRGSWKPDLVTIDSLYRFLPPGTNENDNGALKDVFERIIAFADEMNALVIVVHHSTKGDQSDRNVTDVGSGAGSISRAADTHLVLRAHREDDCAVMESRCRSYEPQAPKVIRWTFPLWNVDDTLNPNELRSPKQERQDRLDDEAVGKIVDAVGEIMSAGKLATENAIRNRTGMRKERATRLLVAAVNAGLLAEAQHGEYTHYLTSQVANW